MLEVALFVSLFAAKTADLPPGAVLRLGDARWRAGRQIHRLWFSADGKTLSARIFEPDGKPRTATWDAATGRRVAAPRGEAEPDGDAGPAGLKDGGVLTAGPGNEAEVRDRSGRRLARLAGHAFPVTAVAASADGARLATGDSWGLVRVWDAATLRPLNHPAGHTGPVEHAELSPDGTRLLTLAHDRTLRVWDMTTGKELRTFADLPLKIGNPSSRLHEPTFTPDGLAVAFSVANDKDYRLTARDVLTGLEVPLPGELAKQKPSFISFSPDGKAALTCWAGSCVLEVWDWPVGKKRFAVELRDWPDRPGFAPDGSAVFAAAARPERWDAKTGKPLAPAWDEKRVQVASATIALRQNLRMAILSTGDDPRVVEAGTGRTAPAFRFLRDPDTTYLPFGWTVALSPTGRQLASAPEVFSSEVWVLESATAAFRRKLICSNEVHVLGFTPDGTKLLTAGADHTVLVWDVRPQSMPLPEAVRRETNAAKLWATLCAGKADTAYLAMARLAAEPDAAVKTARLRMKPAAAPTAATLDRILRDLGDDEFAVREAAERELDAHGEPAALLVKERLAKLTSAEARRRAEGFVNRWTGDGLAGVRLADARAVELLESLGTPEAREFLKELAAGEATAERTREAKRALERANGTGAKK